jgi:hypothetical protein
MSTQQLFTTIQNSPLSQSLGALDHLYGAVAMLLHVAGLILVLGSILLVNLRLLGVGLHRQSPLTLARATNPLIGWGLGFLVLSGLFLFLPSAGFYYPNPAFWFKFYLLGLALLVQFTLYRFVTRQEQPHRLLAAFTGLVSLTLWFGVGFAGRAVGFL